MDIRVEKEILRIQKEELTAHLIYSRLAGLTKDKKNAELLNKIAEHEKKHYEILRKYSGRMVGPNRFRVFAFTWMGRILGLTFSLKLMENQEKNASINYQYIKKDVKELALILKDEDKHEKELLNMLDEERLNYMGSVVLGLNDALVELSGALAGFTFAIQKNKTIALMGLITGIAATFSMAASEFLSQRQEQDDRQKALKSSIYTGIAYIITVILLILPYFLLENPFHSLILMMVMVMIIILFFNFYISVARELNFRRRFLEMAAISVSVAALSFGIGWIVKTVWGMDI